MVRAMYQHTTGGGELYVTLWTMFWYVYSVKCKTNKEHMDIFLSEETEGIFVLTLNVSSSSNNARMPKYCSIYFMWKWHYTVIQKK